MSANAQMYHNAQIQLLTMSPKLQSALSNHKAQIFLACALRLATHRKIL